MPIHFKRNLVRYWIVFPMASEVTKLSALCMRCKDGTSGPFTKRIANNKEIELVGGRDMYMAVCDKHLKF